jgi:hypothetical protein
MHLFLKFIFGIELYMFRTGLPSIIRSLALYTQQQVYVIQVLLTACWRDQDGIGSVVLLVRYYHTCNQQNLYDKYLLLYIQY